MAPEAVGVCFRGEMRFILRAARHPLPGRFEAGNLAGGTEARRADGFRALLLRSLVARFCLPSPLFLPSLSAPTMRGERWQMPNSELTAVLSIVLCPIYR